MASLSALKPPLSPCQLVDWKARLANRQREQKRETQRDGGREGRAAKGVVVVEP